MSNAHYVRIVVSGIYTSVSLPLYAFVLYTIVKNRKNEKIFKGAFFELAVCLGVADMSYTVLNWIFGRIRILGILREFYAALDPVASAMISAPCGYLFLIQHAAVLLQTCNRFSALVHPETADEVWSPKRMKMMLILLWTLPSFIFTFMPLIQISFEPQNGTSILQLTFTSAEKWQFSGYYSIMMTFSFFCVVVCSSLYLKTFSTLSGLRHEVQAIGGGEPQPASPTMRAMEKRLVICGFTNFVILTMAFVSAMVFVLARDRAPMLLTHLYGVMVDMLCLANPYVLLACSKAVRTYTMAEWLKLRNHF